MRVKKRTLWWCLAVVAVAPLWALILWDMWTLALGVCP